MCRWCGGPPVLRTAPTGYTKLKNITLTPRIFNYRVILLFQISVICHHRVISLFQISVIFNYLVLINYIVYCILYFAYCILYIVYCVLYIVYIITRIYIYIYIYKVFARLFARLQGGRFAGIHFQSGHVQKL